MKLKRALVFWVCVCCPAAFGQIHRIDDPDLFPETAVTLSPAIFPRGADAKLFFARWGVRIQGAEGSLPVVRSILPETPISILPPDIPVIRNEGPEDSSADRPLILDFDSPVRRIGFLLGNGSEELKATVKAFDGLGNLLGEIVENAVEPFIGPFLGIEASGQAKISKITIDYGEASNAEQISGLIVEFVEVPVFTTFLPQVGEGRFSEGSLQTTVTILNLSTTTAQGSVEFFDSQGQPLPLSMLQGPPISSLELEIPGARSMSLVTSGFSEPFRTGYARIRTNAPIEATALFRILDSDGLLLTQTGVRAAQPTLLGNGSLQRRRRVSTGPLPIPEDVDTAIALVNTSDNAALVIFNGHQEADQDPLPVHLSSHVTLMLEPGEQRALFSTELFPQLQDAVFTGSIQIRSEQPIAVTLLQTSNGLPFSSLPFARFEQR